MTFTVPAVKEKKKSYSGSERPMPSWVFTVHLLCSLCMGATRQATMKTKVQVPLWSTYCVLFHRVLLGWVDRKAKLVSISESAPSAAALPQKTQIVVYST